MLGCSREVKRQYRGSGEGQSLTVFCLLGQEELQSQHSVFPGDGVFRGNVAEEVVSGERDGIAVCLLSMQAGMEAAGLQQWHYDFEG